MLAMVSASASYSAVPSASKLPATFDVGAIDAFLSSQVQHASRVGLSVVIVKDGKVVLANGYGKRSLEENQPVTADTLFAIGSVSKQFTCASVLLLAEEGKLSVKDPVAKYYPKLTRAKDITLLDLMNHVSGYPDYYPLDFVDRRMQRPIEEDELLRQYAGGPLDFEPRSKYSYSNTGYILLGRVVEKVSGEAFGEFLTRRIFKPLGMNHTLYQPGPSDSRVARGYTTFALGEPERVEPEARGWIGAAGGIYSTPGDLAKWNVALLDGKILTPASYALMTAPRKLASGKVSDYGCGLSVKVQGGRQVLSHNGAVSGFNTWNSMVPSTRSAVIMTCNLDGGLGSLPGQVFSLLLREPANVPEVKGLAAAAAAKTTFLGLQEGKVNRGTLSEEFNHFLSEEKIAAAARRLRRFGPPQKIDVLSSNERGGMEVTTSRLIFQQGELRALMYRRPDGLIEQFFVSEE